MVTCFLLYTSAEGDRILLLRRSQRVGTYRGRWAGVSGYLEDRPLEQAYQEIEEELGLRRGDVRILREGEPLEVPDAQADRKWLVHPFLFRVPTPEGLRTDWEHVESRWVEPREIAGYDTVPAFAEALARVYPTKES